MSIILQYFKNFFLKKESTSRRLEGGSRVKLGFIL